MARKTICTLSTANLLHNLEVIRAKAPAAKIMAMVKANGYGHGIRSVSLRLEGHVDALGVASIDEALALRKAGVKTPITLIEGVFSHDELRVASEQGFSVVFHSDHQIGWLAQAEVPVALQAWLKLNTGMGRLGFPLETAADALRTLSENSSVVQPVGIMSHFACADEPAHPMNAKQISAFRAFTEHLQGLKSFCNSAALFAFPDMHYDWVRPGLALYGASPLAGRSAASLGLKPVMTFQTELIAIQNFKRGDAVGYGSGFTCSENMPVGIAAVGYGDGYPRAVRKDIPVLVNGVRCPLIGRVAMDMAAVDLRSCADAAVGDKVTLWGEGLPVEDLSDFSDHIAYDLLTAIQYRVRFEWEEEKRAAGVYYIDRSLTRLA
jgi:alanine racemase